MSDRIPVTAADKTSSPNSSEAQIQELTEKGRALAKVGKTQEAISIFEKALTIAPNDWNVLLNYAQAMGDAEQYSQADSLFQKALELFKYCMELETNNRQIFLSHTSVSKKNQTKQLFKQGKKFLKSGNIEKAIVLFEKVLYFAPKRLINCVHILYKYTKYSSQVKLFLERIQEIYNDAKYYRLYIRAFNVLANLLIKDKDWDSAIELYKRSLELDENDIITLNSYANALVRKGEYDRAIELFKRSFKLDENDIITLNSYANALVGQGEYTHAIELFERALKLDENNVITLNTFANLLVEQREWARTIELFERALKLDENNVITLNNFASFIVKQGEYHRAIELFERALKLDENNVITLNTFANLLVEQGEYNRAIELFERSLKLDEKHIPTLNSYANSLVEKGEYERAIELFELSGIFNRNNDTECQDKCEPNNRIIKLNRFAIFLKYQRRYDHAIKVLEFCLKLDENDVITLNTLANLLVTQGEYERAIELLEHALKLDEKDIRTLNSYGNALVEKGEYDHAIELLERALKLDENNVITLNTLANFLVEQGTYDRAIKLLERALKLDENDVITLNTLANFLVMQGEYERAIELFERALELDSNNTRTLKNYVNSLIQAGKFEKLVALQPNNSYARWKYAQQLEHQGDYDDALEQLLAIDLTTQQTYHANIIRLNLGRLYYRLYQPKKGKKYFTEAIANDEDIDNKDKSIFYAARSLLALNNPDSEEAIILLRQIEESSPRYDDAMKAIARNADGETAYKLFADSNQPFQDTAMLYRAMYHKMSNEVAILKSITQRLLRKIEREHPMVNQIAESLEELQASISQQRATEKAKLATIPHNNYEKLIETVSQTAHDISDEVNNELAAIESKTRRAMGKLSGESPLQKNFEKLLQQLELTQSALNDLKSINEGMVIRRHRFPVQNLFAKWQPENLENKPRLQKARITLNLENPDREFDGDEEKIKSIINEIIENSLKHNSNYSRLSIGIFCKDLINPPNIGMPSIPGDRNYLFIQISDNGKGVPEDKKKWIFQPLHTTSPEDKGSGLGLFIVRQTLQKMGGTIHEFGDPNLGARFKIYLPYLNQDEF